jgi:CheY-like chemotaxis protein
MLRKAGHEVRSVTDGRQAVAVFQAERFDAILMDVEMPEMSGLEATAAIRRLEVERGGHIPIVAVTAHAIIGYRERCLEAGMDDYVSKPIKREHFLRVVEDAVKKRDAQEPATVEEPTPAQGA